MRSAVVLAAHADFTVAQVSCRDDHTGWSPPESVEGYGLVLVHSGAFRRASRCGEVLADSTVGYFSIPGDEERFAHPAGGDVCTSVHVSASLWRELHAGRDESAPGQFYVDARLDLAHRRLLWPIPGADLDFATAERLVRLLGGAMVASSATAVRATPADQAAVEAAREAITSGHPAAVGLLPLARLLGVSPYRLSRAFHRAMGVPLTRFRNRLRVGAAVARLEQGETSLARLAADLGFADQAHLTRTMRAHLGETPARLRRWWQQ